MPRNVRYINHYNIDDWALRKWELNQKLKPAVNYHYGWVPNTPFSSPDRFWHHIPFQVPRTLLFPDDRFEIFSWAAEARSYATGAEPATRGIFMEYVDLKQFDFDDKRKGHSAQFRSTIQKRWKYWIEFLRNAMIIRNTK